MKLKITATVFVIFLCLCFIISCGRETDETSYEHKSRENQSKITEKSEDSAESNDFSHESTVGESSDESSDDSSDESSNESGEERSEEISVEDTIESVSDSYVYHIPERYYSEGLKNLVKRTRQIFEMKWIPLEDVIGFNNDFLFEKNVEVYGMPYGQPVLDGKFVGLAGADGFDATIDDFAKYCRIKGSDFYKTIYYYSEAAPYYSLDCSSLVCYAWKTRNRKATWALAEFGDINGNKINNVQVGDALVKTGEHAHTVLITGVIEDDKQNVIWIEVTEQTPPLTKQTRYGFDEIYSLSDFEEKYLKSGFYIYRNTDFRHNTPYTHSCACPLDGEWCKNCHTLSEYRQLNAEEKNGIITINAAFAAKSNVTKFTYAVADRYYGIEYYKITEESVSLRSGPGVEYEYISYFKEGKVIEIIEKSYDSKGRLWGKYTQSGVTGWVWIGSAEFLGGDIDEISEKTVKASKEFLEVSGFDSGSFVSFKVTANEIPSDSVIYVYAYTADGNKYRVGVVDVDVK